MRSEYSAIFLFYFFWNFIVFTIFFIKITKRCVLLKVYGTRAHFRFRISIQQCLIYFEKKNKIMKPKIISNRPFHFLFTFIFFLLFFLDFFRVTSKVFSQFFSHIRLCGLLFRCSTLSFEFTEFSAKEFSTCFPVVANLCVYIDKQQHRVSQFTRQTTKKNPILESSPFLAWIYAGPYEKQHKMYFSL